MLAALFPGQGSQAVGMARAFYEASPAAKEVLDRAEGALPGLLDLMWGGPEETLRLTANQQPALVAAGAAAFAAYLEAGGEGPRYAAGHSLGEFTALVAARSLSVETAVRLVRARGQYMQEAVPEGEGAMAAILRTDAGHVSRICEETEGVVEVANLNTLGQTVISGSAAAVAAASERLKGEGARAVPLRVSAPFHCSLMRAAAERLAADLARTEFGPLQMEVVSNVTAEPIGEAAEVPGLLERQVVSPVRWSESLERLAASGVTTFLEFGSGQVLTGLVRRTLGDEVRALSIVDMNTLQEAL